jgi:hypothetical protein
MIQFKWTAVTNYCREHFLEVFLTLIVVGCSSLLTSLPAAKVAVLNLYFLPIVLAGFFLGRYRAGALALLSAITAAMLISGDLQGFASAGSPVLVSLTLTVWAAVLGLTAIVVGTLKDDPRSSSRRPRHSVPISAKREPPAGAPLPTRGSVVRTGRLEAAIGVPRD